MPGTDGQHDALVTGDAPVPVLAPTVARKPLLAHHREHLYASGLTDETIAEAEIYSETDPRKIQKLLNWNKPAHVLGACLVFPFRNLDGKLSGYARVRPDKVRPGGGKYESPVGESNHAYLSPAVIAAIVNELVAVGFSEGEKKELAACQAGLICIGLTGVWNWQRKRSATEKADDSPRELIADLAAIVWKGRPVWICFDTDPRRNPSVNQALSEFACLLTKLGAIVTIIELPLGPPDENGIPTKMTIDDFIVAYGEATFHELVLQQMAAQHAPKVSVEAFQENLRTNRIESLNHPGVVYLDRSETGSGKSTADIPAMQVAGTSLTVLATHRNCEEKETELRDKFDLNAAKYPKLDNDTCQQFEEATAVMACGLSVSGALCPTCPHKKCCGYQCGLEIVAAADHRIATHKRAELAFEGIAKGCRLVTVHEDPVSILRPMTHISVSLQDIITVASHCRTEALRWNLTEAPYYWCLENAAVFLQEQLDEAEETIDLELPQFSTPPPTADAKLWNAIKKLKLTPNGDAMRACKALASGQVASLCVRVDIILTPGAEAEIKRSIIVITRTVLPSTATIWLSDATADPEEIASICNLPVIDCTPGGKIVQRHPVLQIPIDVKKSTSQAVFVKTLRAVMARYPAKRFGLICDRNHVPAVQGTSKSGEMLTEEERARISKVEYFRGGEGRGSNTWTQECDFLIVFGTPRVPPTAIKSRLIRRGKTEAAARKPEWTAWGFDYWPGRTIGGGMQTVRTLAYRDRDWHSAYRSVVRAELQQCIGRGRSIRENGIPTVVVTTEDLGVTLVDYELQTLNEFDDKVLAALQTISGATDTSSKGLEGSAAGELTDTFPNIYVLEKVSVKSAQLATHLHAGERAVRRSLTRLEKAGCARRLSARGGWLPVFHDSENGLSPSQGPLT
jgi:hypothetical protein